MRAVSSHPIVLGYFKVGRVGLCQKSLFKAQAGEFCRFGAFLGVKRSHAKCSIPIVYQSWMAIYKLPNDDETSGLYEEDYGRGGAAFVGRRKWFFWSAASPTTTPHIRLRGGVSMRPSAGNAQLSL